MKPSIIFILFFITTTLISCNKGKNNSHACNGDTRRAVKLMKDDLRALVDMSPDTISLSAIGNLQVPDVNNHTGRQAVELKTYTVRAVVDKVKKERDGDYHIRLREGENYLICEVPNPGCDYATGSPYAAIWDNLRHTIEMNDLEEKTVYITGVAFIDIDHHYKRKQAKNNLELHPVLAISF